MSSIQTSLRLSRTHTILKMNDTFKHCVDNCGHVFLEERKNLEIVIF